jgi:hypothetical protein
LKGPPLTTLKCQATQVTDLSPLEDAHLTKLTFTPSRITAGMATIRAKESLARVAVGNRAETIFSAAEFWKKYDAGEFHPKAKKP